MAAIARLLCATSATKSSGGWPYSFSILAFPILTPSLSTFLTSAPTSDSPLISAAATGGEDSVCSGVRTWPGSSDYESCIAFPSPLSASISVCPGEMGEVPMTHQSCTAGCAALGQGRACSSQPLCLSPSCCLSLSLLSLCSQNRQARGPSSPLLPRAQQGHTVLQSQCTRFWSLPHSQPEPFSQLLSALKLCRALPLIWDLWPDGTGRQDLVGTSVGSSGTH